MKEQEIIITETALWSLEDAESYKTNYMLAKEASLFIDNLLDSAISAISEDPSRYRYNHELSNKGVSIRERIDLDRQYKCLYDFNELENKVEILLFVSTKQDFEKMLYRYLILS